MVKFAAGLLIAALMTMFTASTVQKGMRDATTSMMHWNYFPIRDMRYTMVLNPQKVSTRPPVDGAVPTVGIEAPSDLQTLAATLTNPIAPSDSSIARGERQFMRTCVPCHGLDMKGHGPVIQFFVPPPDLLAPLTRGRSDGYIYSYIRHGGAVMPSYGYQVNAEMAWNLVNYLRSRQQANPR